jgi:hypothetical protein
MYVKADDLENTNRQRVRPLAIQGMGQDSNDAAHWHESSAGAGQSRTEGGGRVGQAATLPEMLTRRQHRIPRCVSGDGVGRHAASEALPGIDVEPVVNSAVHA